MIVGVCRLIANHLHLAFFESIPEVRVLLSTGITRLQRSYYPVRLPPMPPPEATLRPLPSHQRVSPDYPNHLSNVPCPLPRRIERVRMSIASPHHAAFPKWQEGRHPHCHFRDAMGRSGKNGTSSAPVTNQRSAAMANQNDLSRSLVAFEQDNTIIAVIEMSLNSWLVAGIVPGIERHPLKKLSCDEQMLLQLLYRWRDEAVKAGRMIARMVVAFEAGRDGFWLARWQRARGIEAYVIHPTSVAVSREHRRAKTDRLDTELLKRAFLGWLRGEPDHCSMAAIPTPEEEDARRPNREGESLVGERTRIVNRMKACLVRF